jgi:hypothetical protein
MEVQVHGVDDCGYLVSASCQHQIMTEDMTWWDIKHANSCISYNKTIIVTMGALPSWPLQILLTLPIPSSKYHFSDFWQLSF